MSTETTLVPKPSTVDDDDDPCHLICCDENWAVCGEDVRNVEFVSERADENLCVWCEAIANAYVPCSVVCVRRCP